MVIEIVDKPESVGLSSERLKRIEEWQRQLSDNEYMPFSQVLIARKGKPVYFKSFGYQDCEEKVPIKPNSIARIYSQTKAIVTVALMQLFERGKFLISDPLWLYLGDKWKKGNMRVYKAGNAKDGYETVPCEHSITISDVMRHASGITYGFDMHGVLNKVDQIYHEEGLFKDHYKRPLASFVDKLAEMPLLFQPGKGWNYGYNIEVVGRLVEVISGLPLDEYLQKEIFDPLEMKDTHFIIPDEKRDRFCKVYMRKGMKPGMVNFNPGKGPKSGLKPLKDGFRYTKEIKFFEPGGGLVGTMEDYYNFLNMLLNGGVFKGRHILSRKTIDWMTINHLPGGVDMIAMQDMGGYGETASHGVGFGFGFSVVVDPAKSQQMLSTGSFGWGGAASTTFWVDPSEEMIVMFFSQLLYRDDFLLPVRAQLAQLVYGCLIDDKDPLRERLRPMPEKAHL